MKNVTTDTTETQKIIGDYYEQLDANALDNLKEMDKSQKQPINTESGREKKAI